MSAQTTESVFGQVAGLICENFDRSEEEITLDSDFAADFGCDSLDQVEFMMAVEEQFGITVSDEDAEKIRTVRQAVEAIQLAAAQGKRP